MCSNRLSIAALLAFLTIPVSAQRNTPIVPTVAPGQDAAERPLAVRTPRGTALTAGDVNAWLDGYMPYALKTGDIAGAVVVVVKDGQILTERGFGYSDVAARKPVDPKLTLFRPGSVAKLFTWTAVMQLVEQGKIDLDVDINRFLDFKIPPRDGQPVTMRNLMQHTAGFEEQVKDLMSSNANAPSFEAQLKRWVPKRIFPAGETPAYSNYGASLAGYIVQRVSGESFDAYLERHIFAPLGMRNSTFRQPLPANLAPLMSKGYTVASKEPSEFEIVGPAPAGAMSSTGSDMANFMIAHLQNGAFNGSRILRPETVEMMHNSPLTLLPPLNRMQLGIFETNINDRAVVGHLGDTQSFHTSLHLFIKNGVGFYVSFNSLGKGGAAGVLRGALFDDFADRYLPGDEVTSRVDSATAADHARMMAGNWVVSRRTESNFVNVIGLFSQVKMSVGPKGNLVMPLPGLNGQPRNWVETTPFVWRDTDSHERLAAKVVDGKVVRFSIDLGPFIVFDRAPWHKNGAWLLPLFAVSVAALALTVVFWPITAIVRRRYGATLALEPRPRRAYRLSRVAAMMIVGALLGWAVLLGLMFLDLINLSSRFEPALWFVQGFGAVAFIGGLLLMLWNLWVVWSGKRRWPARTWSVVLSVAALSVAWVAIAFKLTHFGVDF